MNNQKLEKYQDMAKLIEESFVLFKVFSKDVLQNVEFVNISGNSRTYAVNLKSGHVNFKDFLRIQLRGFEIFNVYVNSSGNISIHIQEHSEY